MLFTRGAYKTEPSDFDGRLATITLGRWRAPGAAAIILQSDETDTTELEEQAELVHVELIDRELGDRASGGDPH